MKNLILALVVLVGATAQADIVKTITCIDKNVQDANFAATFRVQNGMVGLQASVRLFVPTGETSGVQFIGKCVRGGNRATVVSCVVPTSSDSGYTVDLLTDGTRYSEATVTSLPTRGNPRAELAARLPHCTVN
ncbi:MAG TPA: hypothetical protein VFV50_00500 [Bdellovibrionales bacterium]|nr:hypothetical protein [Bdellovibrionales bacterium]